MSTFQYVGLSKFPERGKIRFLKMPSYVKNKYGHNWIDAFILSKDRSITEWFTDISELEQPLFSHSQRHLLSFVTPDYEPSTIPDPFYHRHIAAKHLTVLLYENLRVRWILRKWVQRLRERIMNKRMHGDLDVVTMAIIPAKYAVRVYDLASKSVYCFHARSLQKLICEQLRWQTYAVASPQFPKNPYTNLPWTLGQMISILDQIQTCLWTYTHQFVETWLIRFRNCNYSLDQFQKVWNRELQVLAAQTFFKDTQGMFFLSLYSETVSDLFDLMNYSKQGLVGRIVMDRILPPSIQIEWDQLVTDIFIYSNHNILNLDVYKCYDDMEQAIYIAYMKTMRFVSNLKTGLGSSP